MRMGCGTLRLALALVVVSSAAAAAGPVERLEELARALREETAWTADYSQEYLPAGMTFGEEESGRVWISWPDRARFDTEPRLRSMGLEGRMVRLVDFEVATCDEHGLTENEWQRMPLVALLEPAAALDRFTVLETDAGELVLAPREPGGVDRVVVSVGPDGLPKEVVIVDPQGAENRLRFSSWQASDGPPSGSWLAAPPDGVDCLRDADLG